MSSKPFISDPSVITFRDFNVGDDVETTFNLLNTSFSKNTFRYKGFDDEYSALFETKFVPPSYIAPGNSAPITLIFKPKFNKHIRCEMNFLSETGPFSVQIECIPKSVNIQIDPFEILDFGKVILNEEKELPIIIRNTGALNATWTIHIEKSPNARSDVLGIEHAERVLTFSLRRGTVEGYSTSTVKLNFKPSEPCVMHYMLKFAITSVDDAFEPFYKTIDVSATVLDVPVYLKESNINFGVCFYGELYRQSFYAYNRSDNTQRFRITIRPEFEEFVEFTPYEGFIQSETPLEIVTKVRTSQKINQIAERQNGSVTIPITMEIANQVLPVKFTVEFSPSPKRIIIDHSSIDFGTFYTTEVKSMPLKLTSTLQVPVDFGFVKLPPGLSVAPFDGFGVINPGETVEVTLSFKSKIVKKHNFEATLITLQGSKFVVKCTANIVESPLKISSPYVQFESTPIGESSSYAITVKNTKSQPINFQFQPIEDFFFDPLVGVIQPNSSQVVQIMFSPKVPLKASEKEKVDILLSAKSSKKDKKHVSAKDGHKKTKKKHRHQEEEECMEEQTCLIDPEFTYKIYDKNCACFWKTKQVNGRHHLALKASSLLPTIFVTSFTINKKEKRSDEFIDLSLRRIDFGVVALGQSVDANVEIRSMSRHAITLNYECEAGSFEILSPTAEVQPMSSTNLRIRFCPANQLIFNSKITVTCVQRPNIRITLQAVGSGAAPSISISQQSIDFGNVMVGHTITKSVNVLNEGSFELQYLYRLNPTEAMHHINSNKQQSFDVVKKSEWLSPDQEGEATVSFTPDHEGDFENVLVVAAGGDTQTKEIPIHGSACLFQMFVVGGIEEPKIRTAFDHYSLDRHQFRSSVICEMAYPGPTSQTSIWIGCTQTSDDGKRTNGDFMFDNIATPGFTLSTMKGSVEQGTSTQVTIEYSPPSTGLFQVGQWVVGETSLNLKCGEFNKKVPVKFKCLINMQQSADLMASTSVKSTKNSKRKSRK